MNTKEIDEPEQKIGTNYILFRENKLGKGAFGEVFNCIKSNSSNKREKLCIKVIKKDFLY